MIRSTIAIFLATLLSSPAISGIRIGAIPVDQVSTADLAKFMGLDGQISSARDQEQFRLAKAELMTRANHRSHDAQWALAREGEAPSIQGTPKRLQDSAWWYTVLMEEGDLTAMYRLGVFEKKGLGLPKNFSHGQMLIQRAINAGYGVAPEIDPKAAALLFLGIAGFIAAAGNSAGSSYATTDRGCYVREEVWVPPPNTTEAGHYEWQTRLAMPSRCQ